MLDELRAVIRRIPKGRVATYGQIAELAGHPGCARQVVWALQGSEARGVPWHRVLGAGGKIRLVGEAGLEQRFRLEAEGVKVGGTRVDLAEYGWSPAGKGQNKERRKSPAKGRPGAK